MLPKTKRLNKEKFDTVYNFGTNTQSSVGYFKILPWKELKEPTKVSCVAGRKENKRAVDRSRIRRRGYAVVEQCWEQIPSQGYGIIWFLPKEALALDPPILKAAVETMINSLNNV